MSVLGLLFSLTLAAQTTTPLSLQKAIQLSIAHSRYLKIDSAHIQSAMADVQEAKDKKLPDASISGSYLRLFGADVTMANAQPGKEAPSPSQAVYSIANVTMPIYAGGRIKYGIESAALLQQAAQLSAENNKEKIAYNATQALVNLYKAAMAVVVIQENLQASMVRDTQFSRLEQNGVMARNDLLKAQLQTSNIELSLLDAQSNLQLANTNMDLLLGLPESTQLQIDSSFTELNSPLLPFEEYETMALKQRTDLQSLSVQQKASALLIKSAIAAQYPSLALNGGYIAGKIPNLITVTNAMNIGLGIKYNLGNLWKKNTALEKAKASQNILLANEGLLADDIKLQINKDYQNQLLAYKKTEVYKKAEQQAAENYRITKNKYDNGLATITELLDANVMLLQARLHISAARADAALAYYKLLETAGMLYQTTTK